MSLISSKGKELLYLKFYEGQVALTFKWKINHSKGNDHMEYIIRSFHWEAKGSFVFLD